MKKFILILGLCVSTTAGTTPLNQEAFCQAIADLTFQAVEGVRNGTNDRTLLDIHSWVIEKRKSGILENDTEVFFVGYTIGAAYVSATAIPDYSPDKYRLDYLKQCHAGKTF